MYLEKEESEEGSLGRDKVSGLQCLWGKRDHQTGPGCDVSVPGTMQSAERLLGGGSATPLSRARDQISQALQAPKPLSLRLLSAALCSGKAASDSSEQRGAPASYSHRLGSAPPARTRFLVLLPPESHFPSSSGNEVHWAHHPHLRQEGAGRMCGNAHSGPKQALPPAVPLTSHMKVNIPDLCGKDLFVRLAPSSLSFLG